MFWKMAAGGLLFAVGLALLWGQAEGQGNGRDKVCTALDEHACEGRSRKNNITVKFKVCQVLNASCVFTCLIMINYVFIFFN